MALLQNFQTQQLHRFASLLSALGNQTVDLVHTLNRGKILFSGFLFNFFGGLNYLVGLFIASLVSSMVFPSMLISALAPLDKNSLKWKISENPQRFQIYWNNLRFFLERTNLWIPMDSVVERERERQLIFASFSYS